MNRMIFTKYSAERDRKFAIRTDIVKKEDGNLEVEKRALYPEGQAHVSGIFRWYELLSKEYEEGQFLVNHCRKIPEGVGLSYLTGDTLQQRMEQLAREGKEQEISDYVEQYLERMTQGSNWIPFEKTESFVQVFGNVDFPKMLKCRRVTNIDMIFSNIVLEGKDWHFIDYEWTFDFPVPLHFVLYRACFLASHEIADASCLKYPVLMRRLGIDEAEQQMYASMEEHFQEYVRNNTVPIRDMLLETGYRAIPMVEVEEYVRRKAISDLTVSCTGESEERLRCQSEIRICPVGTEGVKIFLTPPGEAVRLTVTVGSGSGLIQIVRYLVGREERTVEGVEANGMDLGGGLYLVMAETAEVTFHCAGGMETEIYLRIQTLNLSVNQVLLDQLNQLYGQRTELENELVSLKNSKYYKAYEKTKRLLKK